MHVYLDTANAAATPIVHLYTIVLLERGIKQF